MFDYFIKPNNAIFIPCQNQKFNPWFIFRLVGWLFSGKTPNTGFWLIPLLAPSFGKFKHMLKILFFFKLLLLPNI